MKKRPLAVTIVSLLFMIIGIASLFKAVSPLIGSGRAHITGHELTDSGLVFFSAVLALLSAVFMLRGANWARWLCLIWMALHVVLSIFHKPVELAMHSVLLVVLMILLLRPSVSNYFSAA